MKQTKTDKLKERNLYVFNDIDSIEVKNIIEKINDINNLDNRKSKNRKRYNRIPIKLHINSFGGDVYAALSLYSVMQKSKTKVYTIANGAVMSAALIIYLAGKKRFAYPYSSFMYHELTSFNVGKLKELKDINIVLKNLQKQLDFIVTNRTNIKQKKLNKIRKAKKDWYINLKDAFILKITTKNL